MSSDDVVVRVSQLSKCYHVYKAPQDRIKQFLMPRIWRMLGRPVRNLYQEFWALEKVSFEIRKGETFGVIGRNGAGKSTLLQMICGTLNPTSGSIEVNGRVAALLELGAGFNPDFTGRENVYMNATLLGLSKTQIDERFDAIQAFADIGEFIERPVKTYSSGMYVRLAFAVIVHVDADILVIDEALAVGDVFFTQKCMRFLREFVERGTLIFVTHDTNSVMSFCSEAVWLEGGRQRMLGSSKDVCEGYLEELYHAQEIPIEAHGEAIEGNRVLPGLVDFKDARQDYINLSNLRNDLQVLKFDASQKSFGSKQVEVVSVFLATTEAEPLSLVIGGEIVDLIIYAKPRINLLRPIIGFVVKDRVGQNPFGDNTFLSFQGQQLPRAAGSIFSARFRFRMPVMPAGDYSIAVAVAEGTQDDHVVHAWIHDALIFKSQSSTVTTGLLGIPMLDIAFE